MPPSALSSQPEVESSLPSPASSYTFQKTLSQIPWSPSSISITTTTTTTSSPSNPPDRPLLPGVYVPTVAFFDDNEDIDIDTTITHATRLAHTGIAGLVTHGSNGEAVHLDRDERSAITRATRHALDASGHEHLPLIVGCGAQSVRQTVALCRDAAAAGGDYALILPPAYYSSLMKPAQIQAFFTAVATASPIPILLYNYPPAANGIDLSSDAILSLAAHPNIVGVKLTCGNTGKLCRIAAQAPEGFLVTGGSADFILQTLAVGGAGVIAGLANVAPKSCVRVFEAARDEVAGVERGERAVGKAAARQLQAVVARGDWTAIQGGFAAVKAALRVFEGYSPRVRRPCVELGKVEERAVVDGMWELMELEREL